MSAKIEALSLSATTFAHRHNEGGTVDSICCSCFATIATRSLDEDLRMAEAHHACEALAKDREQERRDSNSHAA